MVPLEPFLTTHSQVMCLFLVMTHLFYLFIYLLIASLKNRECFGNEGPLVTFGRERILFMQVKEK